MPSPPGFRETKREQPNNRSALQWVRDYLALTIFITSTLSVMIGLLITATLTFANTNNRMAVIETSLVGLTNDHKISSESMISVDHRLDEGAANLINSQRDELRDYAQLHEQIAVLTMQLKFFAGRSVAPDPKEP